MTVTTIKDLIATGSSNAAPSSIVLASARNHITLTKEEMGDIHIRLRQIIPILHESFPQQFGRTVMIS